jgi:uncharacterized protein
MLLVPRQPRHRQQDISAEHKEVVVESHDGLQLHGTHFHSPAAPLATVILCHGVGSCKENMYSIADWLAGEGYESIAMDMRGHGESGGEYCTYGYYEKQDLSALIDQLALDGTEQIVVLGISMGGAVAIQALDYDDRIDAAVAISTFSSLRGIALDYQERITGLDWVWLNSFVADRAEDMSGLVVDSVNVEAICRRISKPVFIAHGSNDSHIIPEYAERNFAALQSRNKEMYLVEGAGHLSAWRRGGEDLKEALRNFLHGIQVPN